jgi:hypothetical protein
MFTKFLFLCCRAADFSAYELMLLLLLFLLLLLRLPSKHDWELSNYFEGDGARYRSGDLSLIYRSCRAPHTEKALKFFFITAYTVPRVTYIIYEKTVILCIYTIGLFICSGRQLPSARRQGVVGYPKQSATVSVGSVLK